LGLGLRFDVIPVSAAICRLSNVGDVVEFGMRLLESEAALILRELTGMREVPGGLPPYNGEVMISARDELSGMSLLVLRWSGRWGSNE